MESRAHPHAARVEDRRFFRLGFAWPTREELARGLEGLDLAAAAARAPV